MASVFSVGGDRRTIEIVARRPRLVVRIDERLYEIDRADEDGIRNRLRVNGETVDIMVVRDGDACFVRVAGRTHRVALIDPLDRAAAAGGGDEIRAPMPGVVVAVHKQPGETVRRGETILTIESMKLQTALTAPCDGVLDRLARQPDEAFGKDEVLAAIGPAQGEECAG